MTKKRRSTARQTTISTVAAVIFILGALFVQYVLGIDLGVFEEIPTATPVTAPPVGGTPVAVANTLTAIPGGYDGGWFQVYFTTPINTTDESRFTGAPMEEALVKALDGAQQSIDAALFELNSQPVTDALLRAVERDVTVRMVTDGEHGLEDPEATFDQLEMEGVELVSDGTRNGFMHNKFFVIDKLYVWTGSTNITHNGFYNNNNNAMLIRSSRIAANYNAEFEELFSGSFGKTSGENVPTDVATIENTPIETIFESEGDVPGRLIELFNTAHSVRFMAFSFTRGDMFEPLIARTKTGELTVQGIVEASSRQYVDDLYCAGIAVNQDGNPDILHHKVFIIDDSIVVMGSFNFSGRAADDNDENTLIIHNPQIASAYLEEFNKRWAESNAIPADAMKCS